MIGCDVGDAEQVRGMMAKVLADYGKIDILINNAGVGMRQPFVDMPLETVEEIMRTNFLGAVYCAHEVLPSMIGPPSAKVARCRTGLKLSDFSASKVTPLQSKA